MNQKINCEFCKKEILPINWKRHQNSKRCREYCFEKCGKSACFHFEVNSSQTHRLYCFDHKLDNMVNVLSPRCKHEKCRKQPKFNYEGETKGLYCSNHKLDNMVNVVSTRCKHENCNTQSTFNYEGETKRLYCSKHGKKLGMVNVVSTRCKHENCNTQPNFNYEGETKGLYCSKHKLDNMVDVVSPRCKHENCESICPTFNYEGETKGLYCSKHKLDNMVDVKHPTCKHEKCSTQPNFNYEGETKGLYCSEHGKKLGMVNVVSPRCKHENCESICPTFNYEGETKGLYCSKHKLDNMVDVENPTCKLGCGTRSTKKYRDYCFRCFIRTFPDEPVSRNYKTKELYVADFVKNIFHDKTIVCDKVVSGGCSRRRPDIMIDFGYQILIVEVDEGQHELYETTCEEQRINDIYTDLGDRPIVLIRFNPDGYKTKNGNITSCWGPNQRGITVVKKSKKKEWEQRLSVLKEKITYWCHNESNKPLETEYLFFDKI